MTPARAFTSAGYRALLRAMLARGYRVRRFRDADPRRADLILRHDVDLWPEAAVKMARIETKFGVEASYFFLTGSAAYALDEPETRRALADLAGMGHEIGLHFDAAGLDDDAATLDRAAAAACARLEQATGRPVETISFHRPARALLGRSDALAGRVHAYQPRYFSQMDYRSDSRGRWRHGHPLDRPAVAEERALQLLTHPIWWVADDSGDREAALATLVAARGEGIRSVIADTVAGYDPATGRITEPDEPATAAGG